LKDLGALQLRSAWVAPTQRTFGVSHPLEGRDASTLLPAAPLQFTTHRSKRIASREFASTLSVRLRERRAAWVPSWRTCSRSMSATARAKSSTKVSAAPPTDEHCRGVRIAHQAWRSRARFDARKPSRDLLLIVAPDVQRRLVACLSPGTALHQCAKHPTTVLLELSSEQTEESADGSGNVRVQCLASTARASSLSSR